MRIPGFSESLEHSRICSAVSDVLNLRAKHDFDKPVSLFVAFWLAFDVAGRRALLASGWAVPINVFGRGLLGKATQDALVGNVKRPVRVPVVGRT